MLLLLLTTIIMMNCDDNSDANDGDVTEHLYIAILKVDLLGSFSALAKIELKVTKNWTFIIQQAMHRELVNWSAVNDPRTHI